MRREILPRWRYPSRRVLEGSVFPSGRPPFGPFPKVTTVLNACLCPVALVHDLLHGSDNALISSPEAKKRGNLFHRFIAYLKIGIKEGRIELRGDISRQLYMIQHEFREFARGYGFTSSDIDHTWRNYIEPWVKRKIESGELEELRGNSMIFFEVYVANPYTEFPLPEQRGRRRYPLRGIIDEIDLNRRLIIERTIKGQMNDENPPLLKDMQVWLLWRALSTLSHEQLPPEWRNVDFRHFRLIVETPHNDFEVEKDREDFISRVHWAYAWINDVALYESPDVIREAWENAQCSPENPHPECGHKHKNCFYKRLIHPQCRPQLKQAISMWYRHLLWEQMWRGDLWHYRITMLPRDYLIDVGLLRVAHIINAQENELELELELRETQTFRGFYYCTVIPFGTLQCGIRAKARVSQIEDNHIKLEVDIPISGVSVSALILMSSESIVPMIQEPPVFLQRRIQRGLFKLQTKIGTNDERTARRRSSIQLLEALFGTRPLTSGCVEQRR